MLSRLKLYQTLSHRPIFMLWAGQALSAVGDEIYRVALTWIAVGMVGEKAGFLGAGQAAAILTFSLIGGIWSDRWDPRRTMIFADLARGLFVLLPVIWSFFFPLNIWLLGFVAFAVAAFSAFFDPALQAVVPKLAPNRALLQAANGLMGTTMRLARAVGPSFVGTLTGFVPIVHFFTVDALSFVLSAWAIAGLKKYLPPGSGAAAASANSLRGAVLSGFLLVRPDSVMKFVILSKALTTGVWHLVLPLGVALLVREKFPGDLLAYGILLGSYGIGNITSALVITNITMKRPMRVMGWGFVVLGVGFTGLAVAPTVPLMAILLCFAAFGGPMNDLAHLDVIQSKFPPDRLVPIVRFRLAMENGGMLVFMLLAPVLFGALGARPVLAFAGGLTMLVGLFGVWKFGEKTK